MTEVITSDGVHLYAEATGSGLPVLFIHEFAADHRTWSRQVDALSGTFRCVTYASRGYPPSEVPPEQERYNYLRQADDAIDVLDAFGIARAHVVGLSMGGFCALQLGIRYPGRVSSLLVASAGSGASPGGRAAAFLAETEQLAAAFRADGMAAVSAKQAMGPNRIQLRRKNAPCLGKSSPASWPSTRPKAWPSPSSGSSVQAVEITDQLAGSDAWSTATRTRPTGLGPAPTGRTRRGPGRRVSAQADDPGGRAGRSCRTRGMHSTWRSPSCSMT